MISIILRLRASSQEFHIMLRTLFSLKCMTTTSGWIYIYSFLFSVHLIKCKKKRMPHCRNNSKIKYLKWLRTALRAYIVNIPLDSSDEIEAVLHVCIRLLSLLYTDDNIIFWFCYWIILVTCYCIMLYRVHIAWAGFEHIRLTEILLTCYQTAINQSKNEIDNK